MPSSSSSAHQNGSQQALVDYARSPVVLFWEITKACALACRHCRARAQPRRDPRELDTRECFALVDEIRRFEPKPILVISGGDPLMRRDLFRVAGYAVEKGIRTSLSPSVTALITPKNLARAYDAGVRHISFSLDGATPQIHDEFRGIHGSFEKTLKAIDIAREAGLTVQVNTTITTWNAGQLDEIARLVEQSGAILWDLFFLVPTGRALCSELLSPEEHERAFKWIYQFSQESSIRVKTTLGQPFRRVMLQEAGRNGIPLDSVPSTNDGKGIAFISHIGEIYPSGFLPVLCGNVRTDSIVDVYQTHPVFLALRDPDLLGGKCGRCPYRGVCGGCRARAYALTGDYLAAEPCCVFQPDEQEARAPASIR